MSRRQRKKEAAAKAAQESRPPERPPRQPLSPAAFKERLLGPGGTVERLPRFGIGRHELLRDLAMAAVRLCQKSACPVAMTQLFFSSLGEALARDPCLGRDLPGFNACHRELRQSFLGTLGEDAGAELQAEDEAAVVAALRQMN